MALQWLCASCQAGILKNAYKRRLGRCTAINHLLICESKLRRWFSCAPKICSLICIFNHYQTFGSTTTKPQNGLWQKKEQSRLLFFLLWAVLISVCGGKGGDADACVGDGAEDGHRTRSDGGSRGKHVVHQQDVFTRKSFGVAHGEDVLHILPALRTAG